MAIQWDTRDDTLWFRGSKIGEISKADADGKVTVTFSFSYSCSSAEAHLPIIALATALSAIPAWRMSAYLAACPERSSECLPSPVTFGSTM